MYDVFSAYSAFPSWRALLGFRPCASQSHSSLSFLSLSVCHDSSDFSCPPRFLARPFPLRSLLSLSPLLASHTVCHPHSSDCALSFFLLRCGLLRVELCCLLCWSAFLYRVFWPMSASFRLCLPLSRILCGYYLSFWVFSV